MHSHTAAYWAEKLDLLRHPEGGWFRETYRAAETIPEAGLPTRFQGERAFSTAIHFLLERDDFSALHRLKSDEVWHFYDGGPLTVHLMTPDGQYRPLRLGRDPEKGERFQAVAPAGCWFGAEVAAGPGDFALVGCTVAPGFDFSDFELAGQADLTGLFPQHAALIRRLTRE
ncbi:cupin domain-containing protein [Geobacter sp. FeAm09]|uniref:cupin domain-containing protein n=1 Tax=Geobacter sp. FeAm09 TaxID=2597769 RepID=UPI001F0D7CD2|nr:cupin domain-containing protein [Geobacter sp. FeAm09]